MDYGSCREVPAEAALTGATLVGIRCEAGCGDQLTAGWALEEQVQNELICHQATLSLRANSTSRDNVL